jgi:hypothetical protein
MNLLSVNYYTQLRLTLIKDPALNNQFNEDTMTMFKRLGRKDIIESNEPIDSDEQERITKTLIDEALVSSKSIRQTFSWIFHIVAFIFVIVLAYSSAYPMIMSHQAVFAGYVPHYYFQLFYALTIISLYGDAAFVKVTPPLDFLLQTSMIGYILMNIGKSEHYLWYISRIIIGDLPGRPELIHDDSMGISFLVIWSDKPSFILDSFR